MNATVPAPTPATAINTDPGTNTPAPAPARWRPTPARLRWLRYGALLAALLWAADFIYTRSYTIAIDDARIASDVIAISANRAGWITELPISSGQVVDAGQLLVQIDARAASLALQEVDVEIARKAAEVERASSERLMVAAEQSSLLASQQAEVESAEARTRATESALKQTQNNADRSATLRQKQLISKKQWEDDQLALEQAREIHQQALSNLNHQLSDLNTARARQQSVLLQEQSINILNQELEGLKLKREQLQLDVDDRQVRSPKRAVVDKTFANPGEYVTPGRRLLMLHDPDDIWISANIKETDVRKVTPGMRANVKIDAYPDRTFSATVTKIGNAATSEFALLPNPNPSGNFTKVTQRLQISLAIAQQDNLLKPGMMVEVLIDTRP